VNLGEDWSEGETQRHIAYRSFELITERYNGFSTSADCSRVSASSIVESITV
jgi:hypothetical protein